MLFFVQTVFYTFLVLAIPAAVYLLARHFSPRFFRRLAYEIHLWLGIISGLILFVVCLSGTILVFKTEIIQFLERDRYFLRVAEDAVPKPLEELIAKMEKSEGGKVVRVTIPRKHNQAWVFNIRKESDGAFPGFAGSRPSGSPDSMSTMRGAPRPQVTEQASNEQTDATQSADNTRRPHGERAHDAAPRRERPQGERPRSERSRGSSPIGGMPAMHAMLGTAYLVDPFTGESFGPQRSKTYMFFMSMQFLHRFLWLDIRTGQIIVGSATIVFMVLAVGGLFLWFPPKLRAIKAWFLGLKVRVRKGWGRFLYDTHNTLGFYSLIPLMIMAVTGPVISFTWYRKATGKVIGTQPFAKSFSPPMFSKPGGTGGSDLPTWGYFLAQSEEMISRKGFTRISIPQSPTGSVGIQVTGEGFCRLAATDKIQFDRYSGEVLKSELFDDMNFGEQVSTLIFPLHNGEIFGTVSKCIYFITCLIATTLPLTGVILWVKKLMARRRKNKRSKAALPESPQKLKKNEKVDLGDLQKSA